MNKTALVTGAGGFVGSHLVGYLKSKGWEVFGCDLVAKDGVFDCDITDDLSLQGLLDKIFTNVSVLTHIFHLSAVTYVPESISEPNHCFEVNTLATVRLISHLIGMGVKPIFIYVSTSEVYGVPEFLPVNEKHRLSPQNPYSISKMAGDLYCQFAFKQYGFPTIIVRPFNHSGPGQNERFVLSSFVKQFVEMEVGLKEKILLVGNLDVERDFLHVSDVVSAYELIALKGKIGEVYNVCSGRAIKLINIIEVLKEITGIKPEVVVDPLKTRQIDVPSIYGSYEKLYSDTGWMPKFSIDDLIKDLLLYWRSRLSKSK